MSTQLLLFPSLAESLSVVRQRAVPADRQAVLQPFIAYVRQKRAQGKVVHLNFICTHNSRRSQLSQIWAQTAADFFGVAARCYSGGVEVTAFNERAVASIRRSGFQVAVEGEGSANPVYLITHSEGSTPIRAFSKLYDDPANGTEPFAAIMTCSHADENCPFIPMAEQRLPVRYEDPKLFDGTPQEAEQYDERSAQIASEWFFAFSEIVK